MRPVLTARSSAALVLALSLAVPAPTAAQETAPETETQDGDTGWPREVETPRGVVTIYQPQVDSWDGARLEAHAAVSVVSGEQEAPVFGVVWLSARTLVDKAERLVTLDPVSVERVSFPSAPERAYDLQRSIQEYAVTQAKEISLDRLEAALEILEAAEAARSVPVANDPPAILFSSTPALLVYVDGTPAWRPLKDTPFERVINARPLLVRRGEGQPVFLHVFDGWMTAPGIDGPWQVAREAPAELSKAVESATGSGQVDLLPGGDPDDPETLPSLGTGPAPAIVVATRPTELIVTDGQPNYLAITGTDLLYVENTTGNVFKNMGDQQSYVLISGRWFRAPTEAGPWEFVPNDGLPDDFAVIPDESPKENVKSAVAGTPQAKEALISNSIPQTAEVKRAEAKLTPPQFDGPPELEPIDGTELQRVANTSLPLILAEDGRYYAVENGIWFVSPGLEGPWVVADTIPASIYSIPPSSPVHNVTYVRVYQSTPEVVYVGYTPGYYGTCVSHGAVVYGTGYYYHPWVGTTWYGPPVTYGFGATVSYTPWTGWTVGFGFGWSWGRVTVGWGWGPYPWWGPIGWGRYYPYPYYRPPYYGGAAWGPRGAAVWGPGGWAATTGNVYHRWGGTTAVTRRSGGYNAWTGDRWGRQAGMSYNSRTGTLAAGQRAGVANVYTGNYAAGARGTAVDTRTGRSVTGARGTVGNVDSGRSVSGGRVTATDPRTGQSGSAGVIHTDRGTVGRVGDDIYAGRDGNVYRRGDGGWERHSGGDSWSSVKDSSRTRSLDSQQRARSQGQLRQQNYRATRGGGGGARGGGARRRR